MVADRSKVLQQAQLLASRGQYDAAIEEWKKLAQDTPNDGSIHNSIGDLHLRRNASAEAATAFLQAGEAFRGEGATLKAIAAFKKVLKIDPTRYEVYRYLGDLNVERGLLSSAVQDYLTLGKYYLKERKGKQALEIYRKIISQDPSNLSAQERMAELCVQEDLQDEATKMYLQLGRERSAQGRHEEAKDAYLAVLKIDPKNSEASQFVEGAQKTGTGTFKAVKPGTPPPAQKSSDPLDLLAEATRRIEEKQYAGAEAILNQMLTREPGNPQVCQLLARLHLQRGDVQIALGEYRFLAGAALRAEDFALAGSLIKEFLSAQPNSVPLLELHGELCKEQGDCAEAAQHYAKAVELLLEHPEPGLESLHEELFEKVRSLSTDAALVERLGARLRGEPAASTSGVSALEPELDSAQEKPTHGVHATAGGRKDAATHHVAEQPTPAGPAPDLEAHFMLGVAYKNMGLYPEAREEFEVSKTGEAFHLDSCLMTAVCHKAERQFPQAIQRLESLLSDPRCQGAKGQAIRYELGLLFEAQAQWDKAAHTFQSIPSFHDVPQRLEALKKRSGSGQAALRRAS